MQMLTRYGPRALIVGGSEGIGAAMAQDLAREGIDLLLVARSADKLEAAADEIRRAFPERDVRTLATDMSVEAGAQAVIKAAEGLEIGLLIYNAGACTRYADFHDAELDFNLQLSTLNMLNKLRLVHYFGQAMRARRKGGILLMGSGACAAGLPGFTTYSAVKAFSNNFSEGLWHEMRPYGVDVLGFVVGQTSTPAIHRNYPERNKSGADPADVARHALASLPDGPIAYAENTLERFRMMRNLTRKEAVELMYEGSAIYRNAAADRTKASA